RESILVELSLGGFFQPLPLSDGEAPRCGHLGAPSFVRAPGALRASGKQRLRRLGCAMSFSPGQDRHRAVGRLPFRSFSDVLMRRLQRMSDCALLAAATTLSDELYLRPVVRNGHFGS